MNDQIFNREAQRLELSAFASSVSAGKQSVCWLEGKSGAGKSTLLRHTVESIKPPIFSFPNDKYIYKCYEGDEAVDYKFISSILVMLEISNRSFFSKLLYEYCRNISSKPLLETIFGIIPFIKGFDWFKGIQDSFKVSLDSVNKQKEEKFLRPHMNRMYIEIIHKMLPAVFPENSLTIFIDDVAWIDLQSMEIILAASKRLRDDNYNVCYAVTTRDYNSLSNRENFIFIEEAFRLLCCEFHSIRINNFDNALTNGFLKFNKRYELTKNTEVIFSYTKGNLQELTQMLKLSDSEIESFCIRDAEDENSFAFSSEEDTANRYFSLEYLKQSIAAMPNSIYILAAIYILRNDLDSHKISYVSRALVNYFSETIIVEPKFKEILSYLQNVNIIRIKGKEISFAHDSERNLVKVLLIDKGLFISIHNEVAAMMTDNDVCKKIFAWPDNITHALRLHLELDINNAFSILKMNYAHINEKQIVSKHFVKLAARCVKRYFRELSSDDLNNIAVNIANWLVRFSCYAEAVELAELIYEKKNDIVDEIHFDFYYSTAIAMRESDIFDHENRLSSIKAIKILLNSSCISKYQRVLGSLTYCSILEHFWKYEEIKRVHFSLPALIDDVEDYYERCVLYAKYYRNMGLVKDHKDLIEDYLTGLSYIRKIRVAKDYDAIITRGTLNNNLGLAYLHSGHLEEAISAFESSHSTLHDLNYDEYTPLTNLSACFAMQNDYSKAYEYLLLAKSFPGKSKYREICIDVNLSLVYWKLNKKEEALELIKPILGIGGKSREIFDSEIQIRTYLNYGYFMMKEGKYAEAAAAFKKSMDFNFRISPDIQIKKRTLLMMYSLSKAGLLIGQDLGDISCVDLDETGGIPASRPYDYHTLAFYFS